MFDIKELSSDPLWEPSE